MPIHIKKTVNVFICYFLLFVFVYTSFDKIRTYDSFINDLNKSVLIPNFLVFPTSILIIILELTISVLLLFNKTKKIGFMISGLLFILFTGYIFLMLYFSPYLPCSCGGIIGTMTWNQHLVFNITSTVLSFIAFSNEKK